MAYHGVTAIPETGGKGERERSVETKPLLIPIFHGLEVDECKDLALPTRDDYIEGFRALGCLTRMGEVSMVSAMEAVEEVTKLFMGVENNKKLEGEEIVRMMGKKVYEYFVKEFGKDQT